MRTGLIAFSTLMLCGAAVLAAEPTPPTRTSWVSFRNGLDQRGIAGSTLPEKLELLWEVRTEFGVLGTSAIVGDHVYVPTLDGYLLCLSRIDGKELWKYRSIESEDPKAFAPGFKAAPLVTDTRVFVGDEEGVFHAVDRATGKQVWKYTAGAEIAGGANLYQDKVIFGSHDSFLYCVSSADGKEIWKFQTENRVNCAPAIAGKHTFISGCDEHLRVVDIETGKQVADIPLGSFLIASPAIVGDVLYVGTYAGEVVALNWKEERFVWRFKDAKREFAYNASAVATDDRIIVGGEDRKLHCIDRETGNEVWAFPCPAAIDSSPALVDKRVFFGSKDGSLYAVDLESGTEVWKFAAGRDISAGPAIGEGCLVVGCEGTRGRIFCFGEKP